MNIFVYQNYNIRIRISNIRTKLFEYSNIFEYSLITGVHYIKLKIWKPANNIPVGGNSTMMSVNYSDKCWLVLTEGGGSKCRVRKSIVSWLLPNCWLCQTMFDRKQLNGPSKSKLFSVNQLRPKQLSRTYPAPPLRSQISKFKIF